MNQDEKEFTKEWIEELRSGKLKSFPGDFLSSDELEEINIESKQLVLGSELFGSYELLDSESNVIHQADSLEKAKYLLYASRTKPEKVVIPKTEDEIRSSTKKYENHLDSLLKEFEFSFKGEFPDSKNFLAASNYLFNALNLKRY